MSAKGFQKRDLPVAIEHIAEQIVDSAFKVHSALGPGLLESVYQTCMVWELESRGLEVRQEVALPVIYDDKRLDAGVRLDLLVEELVIVELKSVERMLPVFDAQLLTYLKLSGKPLGFLINFNVPLIKDGIRRRIL